MKENPIMFQNNPEIGNVRLAESPLRKILEDMKEVKEAQNATSTSKK